MQVPGIELSPADGKGRVAWVTGASSGIGRALALKLAAAGHRVAATARRGAELDELGRLSHGLVQAFPGDVEDLEAMRATVSRIELELGPIDLAVLNAGSFRNDYRRFRAEEVRRTVEVNLCGTANCLDPVLAAMLVRRRGRIAIVASLAGYGGIPGSVAYGAAKAALITMAEGLRLTYGRDGILVQVVNPGFVDTAMTTGNRYPMPFMMSAEAAAGRIVRGLATDRFEITFPRRLALATKCAALLPYRLWMPVMAAASRRVRADED